MIKELWEKLLNVAENTEIEDKKEFSSIINDILIYYKIDPEKYVSNLSYFINFFGYDLSENNLQENLDQSKMTPSIQFFQQKEQIIPNFPIWFCATCPDVIKWLSSLKKEILESQNLTLEDFELIRNKLFGIDSKDAGENKRIIINSKGFYKVNHLKKLIESYRDRTNNILECTIEDIEDDIYSGKEFLNSIGQEDNYSYIAENIAKIYFTLKKNYPTHFKNKIELLSLTGMIDMMVYLENNEVDSSKITNIAEEVLKNFPGDEKGFLVLFIESIEKLIFEIDSGLSQEKIGNAVRSQRNRFSNIIEKYITQSIDDPAINQVIDYFLMSENISKWKKEIELHKSFNSSTGQNKEESSQKTCPACKEGKLIESNKNTLTCSLCGSRFVQVNNKYRYTYIKDTDNLFWLKYNHELYTLQEWIYLSHLFYNVEDKSIDGHIKKEKNANKKCPACTQGYLLNLNGDFTCNFCGAKFHQISEKLRFTFIKDTDNPFWLKYNHEAYTYSEWIRLSIKYYTKIKEWEEKYKQNEISNIMLSTEVHPWRRYFARFFDIFIMIPLYVMALIMMFPNLYYEILYFGTVGSGLIGLFIYTVFFEPSLLSIFGTTPGKALLNISIVGKDGEKLSYGKAMGRNFILWIQGLGLGIPFITAIAMIIAHNRLQNQKVTSWDEKYKAKLLYGDLGFFRILAYIIIYFIAFIIFSNQY
jgi:uncharacterized protein (DUF983 family)/uncharacterized RDD family membrane protein YckC